MHSFPSRGKVKRTKPQGLCKTGSSLGMLGAVWGWPAFLTIASCQAKKDWLNTWSCKNVKKGKDLKGGNIHFTLSLPTPPLIFSMFISRSSQCFALLRFQNFWGFSVRVSRLHFTVTQSFLTLSVSGVLVVDYFYQRELNSHLTLVEWDFFFCWKTNLSLLKGIRSKIGPCNVHASHLHLIDPDL